MIHASLDAGFLLNPLKHIVFQIHSAIDHINEPVDHTPSIICMTKVNQGIRTKCKYLCFTYLYIVDKIVTADCEVQDFIVVVNFVPVTVVQTFFNKRFEDFSVRNGSAHFNG